MEDTPQPTSIKARIAAMKLEEVVRSPASPPPSYQQSQADVNTVNKPRHLPASPPPRPNLEHRSNTVNGAVDRAIGNQPVGKENAGVLPSSTTDRRSSALKSDERGLKSSPPLPPRQPSGRNEKPQLPRRRPSQQAPCLPPRCPSEHGIVFARRDSADSTSSGRTALSSLSAHTLPTSTSDRSINGNVNRKLAPAYDSNKLPPLPPKRPNTNKENENEVGSAGRSMHARPGNVAQKPEAENDIAPALPSRRVQSSNVVPVTKSRASALSFAMNKTTETPPPLPKSRPQSVPVLAPKQSNAVPDTGGQVVELDSSNFDATIIHSGKAALVSFSAPFCHACKSLDPTYVELSASFGAAKNRLVISEVNAYADKALSQRYDIQAWPTLKWFDGSGRPPITPGHLVHGGDLESLQNYITEQTGIQPNASHTSITSHSPTPVPLSSRPNLAQLLASKPKPSPVTTSLTVTPPNSRNPSACLKCRDFSAPDTHAAGYPRNTLPSKELAWLAHQLTDPFPSLTDKARSIFTWLHHNIAYDVDAFFANRIQPATPSSTLTTGLAVCAGYAGLFAALAGKAGMEAVVINGHGKGYGHTALATGAPIPPFESNHAWNAVKLDDGEWKLIDTCWGAGNVQGPGKAYEKAFKPAFFTMSNEEFGLKHYPTDQMQFYRTDGKQSIKWEEYYAGDPKIARLGGHVTVFSGAVADHGLSETSFLPRTKQIVLDEQRENGPIRFQFEKLCPHWDPLVHGKGPAYLFVVCFDGREAGKKEYRSYESNGHYWWCDVRVEELPTKGEVHCYAVTQWNGRDGRGLTRRDFDEGRRPGGRLVWGLVAWRLGRLFEIGLGKRGKMSG